MKRLATLFSDSYHELFQVRTLTLCAMFGALAMILEQFTIKLGTFKLGISGLPNELVHFLFGPVVGGTFGGVMDLLKFLIKPDGGFFFGYTLTAITAGVIYGAFWYKRPLSLPRILAARLAVILYEYIMAVYDNWKSISDSSACQSDEKYDYVAGRFSAVFCSSWRIRKSRGF